jgi:hypothetical protein
MAFFRTILRAITGVGAGERAGRHAAAAEEGRRKAADLWAEVRKALHEGREAEAVGLARQAAGIEGRGEERDSPFGFSASAAAAELAALAKVPIGDALPGLDSEGEHLLRAALAFGSLRGDGLDIEARHVEAVLLGTAYDWPEFDRWHREFSQAGRFPAMWKGLEKRPDAAAASEVLGPLGGLSFEARMVVTENAALERRVARSLAEIRQRSFLNEEEFARAVPELRKARLLKHPADAADRLLLLDTAAMRSALADRDLKRSGRKEELAERLAANMSEEEIAGLTPAAPDDLALVGQEVQGATREALAYERAKLWLITHTLSFMGYSERDVEGLRRAGHKIRIQILEAGDECPICRRWAGRSFDPRRVNRSDLPPYHPGCRCDTVADLGD